jgi:hypothetical protein
VISLPCPGLRPPSCRHYGTRWGQEQDECLVVDWRLVSQQGVLVFPSGLARTMEEEEELCWPRLRPEEG